MEELHRATGDVYTEEKACLGKAAAAEQHGENAFSRVLSSGVGRATSGDSIAPWPPTQREYEQVDARDTSELTEQLRKVAEAAAADPEVAAQVRAALAESGVLAVFGVGDTLDVVDLLDAGGEGTLRARLTELPVADLRAIITAHQYDPEKETARWRSTAKLIDFILTHAQKQLEEEQAAAAAQPKALAAASWML